MSSEKSPFAKDSCFRPRPIKSKEPIKKYDRVILTTKDCLIGQRKGWKAPTIDFTRPRWIITYKGGKHISKRIKMSEALTEFCLKHPKSIITEICPTHYLSNNTNRI